MILTLPWPPSKLSPNARIHWRPKAALTAKYRMDCYLAARAGGAWPLDDDSVEMLVTFCPPDRRRRDKTNCIGAFKAGEDGLSDALAVDDSRFITTHLMGDVVRGGAVVVEIASDAKKPAKQGDTA